MFAAHFEPRTAPQVADGGFLRLKLARIEADRAKPAAAGDGGDASVGIDGGGGGGGGDPAGGVKRGGGGGKQKRGGGGDDDDDVDWEVVGSVDL
jgi:hypothetical protein